MQLNGSIVFDAAQSLVWTTLHDPDALKKCIPGVESFEPAAAGEFVATLKIGVGAIKGTYTSRIRAFDDVEPRHYKLAIDASGRPGFVRGEGSFELSEEGGKTTVNWTADAQVGGLVAGVGQRVLVGVARMLIAQLWNAMGSEIAARRNQFS